jgi:antitoxin HicB
VNFHARLSSDPTDGVALGSPVRTDRHAQAATRQRERSRASAAQTRLGSGTQRGSHVQLKHPERGGRVTVPIHAGETIGPRLLSSILRQANVDVDELRGVL